MATKKTVGSGVKKAVKGVAKKAAKAGKAVKSAVKGGAAKSKSAAKSKKSV